MKRMVVADLLGLLAVSRDVRAKAKAEIRQRVHEDLEPWVGDVAEFLRILDVRNNVPHHQNSPDSMHLADLRGSCYRALCLEPATWSCQVETKKA